MLLLLLKMPRLVDVDGGRPVVGVLLLEPVVVVVEGMEGRVQNNPSLIDIVGLLRRDNEKNKIRALSCFAKGGRGVFFPLPKSVASSSQRSTILSFCPSIDVVPVTHASVQILQSGHNLLQARVRRLQVVDQERNEKGGRTFLNGDDRTTMGSLFSRQFLLVLFLDCSFIL